jgi:hypothetical protein
MSEIDERELRNFNINTRNITFRKKNSKKARSVISISESAQLSEFVQLPALPESPSSQLETPAEPQSLFSTGNTPHSIGNAPIIIFL